MGKPIFLIFLCIIFHLGIFPSGNNSAPSALPDIPLEAKIGQMLMVGFAGSRLGPDHPLRKDLTGRHLGGVILFAGRPNEYRPSGNIQNRRQLKKLTADLQAASPTPLLIAVDQEGGRVARLGKRFGFPSTPSFAWLGQKDDPALTHRHAAMTARTLRQVGINFNLSPVVDLDRNPENPVIGGLGRSFSTDPEGVARHAREVVLAHREAGILTALKHFPGHGSSAGDTHKGFVDITESWSPEELRPYSVLLDAELTDTIMTAHVFNARLDPEYPATLSSATLRGLLRQGLGYDGVILSDDLRMQAISANYPYKTALEKAINAGVDILLISDTRSDVAARTIDLIRNLVAEGRITPERIEESYLRISRLKAPLTQP